MSSLSPQTLSQEDLNLLRNDRIKFECGPLVYQTIIEWGFEKPDGVTIKDHVENQKIEEKIGIKLGPWFKKNKTALDKEDFSNFDITTLHELLPILCCDKVAQAGGKEWEDKLKDENSIEHLLKKIKSFRNDVSHEHSKAKEDPKIEDKKILMKKCIRTAGTLYCKDQSEIETKMAKLDAKFDELVNGTTSSYENAVKNVTKLVENESAPFMLEKYSDSFSVPLPGGLGKIDTSHIFQSVNLSVAIQDKVETNKERYAAVKYKNELKKKKIFFSSRDICNNIRNNFVVISGGPGTGKTTLMRNLYQNILDKSVNGNEMSYEGIGGFRVPIYLECRTERQHNLRDFLKESIPNFHSPKEVIYDAFKEMKGKVFLIDGYDEVNEDSRKLVDEIIPFCNKYDATCIVSGRVDAGYNFIKDLQDRNLRCDKMLIEPISEMSDKVRFLKRYGNKMGDSVDAEELVKSFESLNEAAQKVFCSPILLALYFSLFLNDRNSFSKLHNELNTYKAIREIFSKEIEKKLRESNVPNSKLKTKDILTVFSYFSLKLFNSEKYFFDEDDYCNLVEIFQQKLSRDVDFEDLLTCILTPETSLKQGNGLTYAFTHSTIQEYLAVEQVIKNLREPSIDWNSWLRSKDSLRKNFLKCLGASRTKTAVEDGVERYGNIIKLLILETSENGELTNYTKTFTAVLREYFRVDREYLLDLVSSSNCDSFIVSIVSDVLSDQSYSYYRLRYSRHIRPLTEVLKKKETKVDIWLYSYESLTDIDCANLGQLVSVLKDDSEVQLNFINSFYNYQPLNGEFYSQLNNSKCKVTSFMACVTSSEHLDILKKVYSGNDNLYISTLPTCDVRFATLEEYKVNKDLRVKYTDDYPSTGSNRVTEYTNLIIADILADGRENVYNILKYLCPKSKQFRGIQLDNCHMTDTDTNELLKKLEEQKIRTRCGGRTEVKERWVNEDKSRNLELFLI